MRIKYDSIEGRKKGKQHKDKEKLEMAPEEEWNKGSEWSKLGRSWSIRD